MVRYDQRLKREISRRDAALARMNHSGFAAAAAAQAKFDRTAEAIGAFVSREIVHSRDVVSAQIDHAKDAYSRELEHTTTTIATAIGDVESSLNPANIVRAHPWGATLGALVGAVLLAPLIRKLYSPPAPAAASATSRSSNGTSASNNSTHHSRWKPLTDALLASLPSLAATLFQRLTQTAKEPPSEPDSEVCHD